MGRKRFSAGKVQSLSKLQSSYSQGFIMSPVIESLPPLLQPPIFIISVFTKKSFDTFLPHHRRKKHMI